jgi:hypothetical protein
MIEPRSVWWARPRKLCALERPGGGGRTHRADRRAGEIEYLARRGVRLIVSTTRTRHNLADYEAAGLAWHHVPVPSCADGAEALDEIVALLRPELRRSGAVAVHGDLRTDFAAAVCAAHLHLERGVAPAEGLRGAIRAGLEVTPEAAALLGVDYGEVQPRSAIAAATASGRSVTT